LATGSLVAGLNIWAYPRNLVFPFLLSGIATFLSFLIIFFIKEPKRVTPEENPIELGISGLKKIFTHKSLKSISIFYVLFSAFTFFIYWLYQPLLGNIGVDVKYYGIFSAIFNLFGILLLSQIEFVSKKINGKTIFIILTLLSSFLYITLAAQNIPIVVVVSMLLLFGSRAIMLPIFNHIANKEIDSKNRATVLSSINMIEKLILVILYPIIGFLLDKSLTTTLVLLGGITLAIPLLIKLEN